MVAGGHIPWIKPVYWNQHGSRVPNGTAICIGRRILLTCLHVVADTRPGRFVRPMYEAIAVPGRAGTLVSPVDMHHDNEEPRGDICALVFNQDITDEVAPWVSALPATWRPRPENFELHGFPLEYGGVRPSVIRFDQEHLQLRQTLDSQTGLVNSVQFLGGAQVGFSGGPLVHIAQSPPAVAGMVYLGGAGAVASAIQMAPWITRWLSSRAIMPERLVPFRSPQEGAEPPGDLVGRQKALSSQLGLQRQYRLTLRDQELRFVLVPDGYWDGNPVYPVMMMAGPIPEGLAAGAGQPTANGHGPARVSRREAEAKAAELAQRCNLPLRLPSRAEWAMAMDVPPQPGRITPTASAMPPSTAWPASALGVKRPPQGIYEWVAVGSGPRPASIVSADGGAIDLAPTQARPYVAFRLCCDLPDFIRLVRNGARS